MTNKVRFFPYWPMTSIQYQYLLNKKISILSQKISKLGSKFLQMFKCFWEYNAVLRKTIFLQVVLINQAWVCCYYLSPEWDSSGEGPPLEVGRWVLVTMEWPSWGMSVPVSPPHPHWQMALCRGASSQWTRRQCRIKGLLPRLPQWLVSSASGVLSQTRVHTSSPVSTVKRIISEHFYSAIYMLNGIMWQTILSRFLDVYLT